MATLNKVFLIGNLTQKPELRHTPQGAAVTDITVAVNREYSSKDGDRKSEVAFIDVVVWAKLAENCAQYLTKGSPVFVEGRLQLDTWENQQGEKRSRLRVVAENIQFLSSRQRESVEAKQPPVEPKTVPDDVPENQNEDDIPF